MGARLKKKYNKTINNKDLSFSNILYKFFKLKNKYNEKINRDIETKKNINSFNNWNEVKGNKNKINKFDPIKGE
tara:strand:- start:430 stop:651 length:222 start_codon:yes stop_codon:yes gene_type:complete